MWWETWIGKNVYYLDDIIIFGADFDTALQNLREIFESLKVANLNLKANKWFLFQTKIKYLGHLVSEERVECDPDKIVDARDWPEPKSKTELKVTLVSVDILENLLRIFPR